jgi:hypothetical protein
MTKGCDNFNWDAKSALSKTVSDISVSINLPGVSITKQVSGPYNPEKDAYRNCSNCHNHYNYH